MGVSSVAYKYLPHVPVIKDTLVQACTLIRVFARQGHRAVARQYCKELTLKYQTCLAVLQIFPPSQHRNITSLLSSCNHTSASLTLPHTSSASQHKSTTSLFLSFNHTITHQTSPTVLHTFPASQHRSITSFPLSHSHTSAYQTSFPKLHTFLASLRRPSTQVQPQEESPLSQVVQVMMNATPEERNPKRPREQDTTLSPPPKKAQHRKLSQADSDKGSCLDEVVSLATTPHQQPGPKQEQIETVGDDVVMSEERRVKEESTLKRENSNEFNSEGGTGDRFTAEGRSAVGFTHAGITEMKVSSLGREMKKELTHEGEPISKVTPEEGTVTDSTSGVAAKSESLPEKQTDVHCMYVGKPDKAFPPEEASREVTPEEGTAVDSTLGGAAMGELVPEKQTDIHSVSEGKTDKAFSPKEEPNIAETSPQRNHDLQILTSAMPLETDMNQSVQSHSTATADLRQPTDPILALDNPVDVGTETLECAKEGTSTTGEERRSQQTKEKKHSSKKNKKRKHSGDKKNLRPNYFVGIQISNPAIHRGLLRVQEDLVAWDEAMVRALVDIATSHITLLVAHLDSEESLAVACAALEESAKRLRDGISAWPLHLTFSGVSNFSNQVVFACVEEDEQHQRLLDMADCVRRVFDECGVCMPDTRELHPHLTIAKLSKAPRIKGKPGVKKIDPTSYSCHLNLHFGTQTVAGLQLLSMNKAKDDSRYYHSDKEVLFDVNLDEEKDHSGCCFPRRPALPITQRRTYTTTTTQPPQTEEEEEEEERRSNPGRWMMPVAGVATLVAAALVVGFALARLRGNQ